MLRFVGKGGVHGVGTVVFAVSAYVGRPGVKNMGLGSQLYKLCGRHANSLSKVELDRHSSELLGQVLRGAERAHYSQASAQGAASNHVGRVNDVRLWHKAEVNCLRMIRPLYDMKRTSGPLRNFPPKVLFALVHPVSAVRFFRIPVYATAVTASAAVRTSARARKPQISPVPGHVCSRNS